MCDTGPRGSKAPHSTAEADMTQSWSLKLCLGPWRSEGSERPELQSLVTVSQSRGGPERRTSKRDGVRRTLAFYETVPIKTGGRWELWNASSRARGGETVQDDRRMKASER